MMEFFRWICIAIFCITIGFYLDGFKGFVFGAIFTALLAGFIENITYTLQSNKKTKITVR